MVPEGGKDGAVAAKVVDAVNSVLENKKFCWVRRFDKLPQRHLKEWLILCSPIFYFKGHFE
jgi:hypothetical protein